MEFIPERARKELFEISFCLSDILATRQLPALG